MPPKLCGKCTKIVYPTEEIKCLDKSWHKGCFKCMTCNMTLNMKNYKGYDKLPYCNAHYPQTKHTVVADTPENRRIAENTKIQSNLHYTREFEASKDKYTQICDTPEMRTQLRNTQNISALHYTREFEATKDKYTQICDTPEMRTQLRNTHNISAIKYHADFEKQKGKKITIADDPEAQRARQNMNIISNVSYHGENDRRQQMEMQRPAEQVEGEQGHEYNRRSSGSRDSYGEGDEASSDGAGRVPRQNPGRIVDYAPEPEQFHGSQGDQGTPYSNRNSAGARQVYDSNIGKASSRNLANQAQRYYNDEETEMSARDATRRVSRGSVKNRVQRFSSSGDDDSGQSNQRSSRSSGGFEGVSSMEQPTQRKVGSISNYDPVNENFGSLTGQASGAKRVQPPQQQAYQPPPQQYQPPPPEPQQPKDQSAGKGMICQAMYDYDAADGDEVSFKEGDQIIFCQPIDAGWMEGTVEKTGQRGMLPSNYVEKM